MSKSRRSSRFLGCLLLLGLLLSACASRPTAEQQQAVINDQQWLSSMRSAGSAFDLGHYPLASRLYSQALERGRQTDRAADIADAAFNLAATAIVLGEYPSAEESLQEAKRETRRQGKKLHEILLLEASLARLQADAARARQIIDQLLPQLPASDRRWRPQALLLSGLLECEAGHSLPALQKLTMAAELLSAEQHPVTAAKRAELQGCIRLQQDRPHAAAEEFDRQSAYLQRAGQYRPMVSALHKAGSAYAAAGENYQAADRLYRAARSAYSQQQIQTAQLLLDKAQTAALTTESPPLLQSIERLRTEMADGEQPE